MISRPVHACIGFFTKSPGLSTNSPYPQNTSTSFGCPIKCGWCGSTIEASQLEFARVTSPPSPGTLPVIPRTSWKKVGSRRVVVKETDLDSSTWPAKADGRPNSGRPAAIVSHSAQDPPSDLPLRTGATSIEPRLEASVLEPS